MTHSAQPSKPEIVKMEYRPSKPKYDQLLACWQAWHPDDGHTPNNQQLLDWCANVTLRAMDAPPPHPLHPIPAKPRTLMDYLETPAGQHSVVHQPVNPTVHHEALSPEETGALKLIGGLFAKLVATESDAPPAQPPSRASRLGGFLFPLPIFQ